MSKEYIERSVIRKMISDTDWYHIDHNGLMIGAKNEEEAIYRASDVISAIENAPAVDVAPVVRGEWKPYWDDSYLSWSHKCSNCSNFPLTKEETIHDEVLSDFCPNCGAKMDGGK